MDDDEPDLPGVITAFGEMPRDALVTESGLARIFGRHPSGIMRAVTRGELPRPVCLFNAKTWTVGSILDHIQERLADVRRERKRLTNREYRAIGVCT